METVSNLDFILIALLILVIKEFGERETFENVIFHESFWGPKKELEMDSNWSKMI